MARSGPQRRDPARRSMADPHSPTTLVSRCRSSGLRSPLRTSSWSSTRNTRIILCAPCPSRNYRPVRQPRPRLRRRTWHRWSLHLQHGHPGHRASRSGVGHLTEMDPGRHQRASRADGSRREPARRCRGGTPRHCPVEPAATQPAPAQTPPRPGEGVCLRAAGHHVQLGPPELIASCAVRCAFAPNPWRTSRPPAGRPDRRRARRSDLLQQPAWPGTGSGRTASLTRSPRPKRPVASQA